MTPTTIENDLYSRIASLREEIFKLGDEIARSDAGDDGGVNAELSSLAVYAQSLANQMGAMEALVGRSL